MADLTLARALAQTSSLPNVLFLFGSDAALVDSGAQALLSSLKTRLPNAIVDTVPMPALLQDPARLLDLFATHSLFNDPTILLVPETTDRGAKLISGFLDSIGAAPELTAVLFSSASLKSKSSLLNAARSSAFASVVSCYDSGFDRSAMQSMLRRNKLRLADDAAEHRLFELLDGMDLGGIDRSFEKLSLYATPDTPLSLDDVEACLAASNPTGLDTLTSALLEGDRALLLSDIAARIRIGEDPGQIGALFGRLLSDLAAGAAIMDGETGGRKPFWKTEQLLKTARRARPDLRARLERSLTAVHELELRLRTSPALPEIELERLALTLSVLLAPPRRGPAR